MNSQEILTDVTNLFKKAKETRASAWNEDWRFRSPKAGGLSPNDILSAPISEPLKALLGRAFKGWVHVDIIHHAPETGKEGMIIFDLADPTTRVGGELVITYDQNNTVTHVGVGPSTKTLSLYLDAAFPLFEQFKDRPQEAVLQDAWGLTQLGWKALGLPKEHTTS